MAKQPTTTIPAPAVPAPTVRARKRHPRESDGASSPLTSASLPDNGPLPLRDTFPYSHLMAVQISIHNLSYNLDRGANWSGASMFRGHGPVAFGLQVAG